jgi:hypothetical protein
MEEKQMTAVQWLVYQLNLSSDGWMGDLINQAKQMEKDQMEKVWVSGLYCETGDRQAFIDYCNETFKH